MKKIPARILSVLLLSMTFLQAAGSSPDRTSIQSTSHDLVDVANNAGIFTTLLAAVEEANLVSTLRGDGPFTVFAPTDDAFAALPQGTIELLLQPENRDLLTEILTLHVVPGLVRSTDLLSTTSAITVNGKPVPVGLRVQNANVIQTDVEASNGLIHVIDAVLLPERFDTLMLMSQLPATTIIERTINTGAPMYNHGNHKGTAELYRQTAMTLVEHSDISHRSKRTLRSAMHKMENSHSWNDKAWIMREALDTVYKSLHH